MHRKPLVHPWPPTQRPFLTQSQQAWLRARDIILPWRSVLVWREGLIEVYTPAGRGSRGLVKHEVSSEYAAVVERAAEAWSAGEPLDR